MSIKQNGGVFGRNPTFNDVTIEGDLIINGEVFTGLDFQGSWNASTNSPALASSVGTNGEFYIVSIAGTTDLNGITNWGIGDWAIFNGTAWQRVEGGADGNFDDLTANSLNVNGTATMDGLTVSNTDGSIVKLESTGVGLGAGAVIGDLQFYSNDASTPGAGIKASITATTVAALGDDSQLMFSTSDGTTNNVNRMLIANNGDLSLYEDTGTTAKFFWDASLEQLQLGSEGNAGGTLVAKTDSDGYAIAIEETSGNERWSLGVNAAGDLGFLNSADTTASVTFDDSGNVGIGTDLPSSLLTTNVTADGAIHTFSKSGTTVGSIGARDGNIYLAGATRSIVIDGDVVKAGYSTGGNANGLQDLGSSSVKWKDLYLSGKAYASYIGSSADTNTNIYFPTGDQIRFITGGQEAARIDASQNLLLGKTSVTESNEGVELRADGWLKAIRSGDYASTLRRNDSDGGILEFNKDGTTVGSIGTATSGNIFYQGGASKAGVEFGSANFIPFNNGVRADATNDLGVNSIRFKDLYLSGGVYLGGTGAANLLDDYESGTWTGTVADAVSGGNESSSTVYGTYIKIGKIVYVQFNVSNINTTGLTAGNDVYITGLPFATDAVTGNAKYTGTAHMSVVTFTGTPFLNADESATVLRIGENNSGVGVDFVVVSELSSGTSDIHGNICYQTA